MKFLKRSWKFIKNYLVKRPLFTIVYGVTYFMKDFSFKKIAFYDEQTFQEKIEGGKSLIRLGDGEIHLMNGGNLGPQIYQKGLDVGIMNGIKHYSDSANYILSINKRVMDKSNQYLKTVNQFHLWLPTKVYFLLYFNKAATYADASIFYVQGAFARILGNYLKKKKVVVVLSKSNLERMKGSLETQINIIEWFGTQDRDCFTDYEDIKNIMEKYKNNKDVVVLLACGPTSKVIAYEYSNYVQCLDVGFGLETFFEGKGREEYLKI